MRDENTGVTGLRAIAAFEAAKGVLVLLAGFGVLDLMHRDVEETAENLLLRLHMDSTRHLSRVFLEVASRVTETRLWDLAAVMLAYAALRLVEAWGLWNRRDWAQWIALLSGALYLPWEVRALVERINWLHAGVVASNVILVIYLGRMRFRSYRLT